MSKSTTDFSSVIGVGLDLAKHVFQIHAIDVAGAVVVAKAVRRGKLPEFLSALPRCLVVRQHITGTRVECACLRIAAYSAGASKAIRSAQQKRRRRCGSDLRGGVAAGQRFVGVRSIDKQAQLMRHRTRNARRSAYQLFNALLGHLAEIGVIASQGTQRAYALKELLTDGFDGNGEIMFPERCRPRWPRLAI